MGRIPGDIPRSGAANPGQTRRHGDRFGAAGMSGPHAAARARCRGVGHVSRTCARILAAIGAPREVQLYFHGTDPEDVAAIIARVNRESG